MDTHPLLNRIAAGRIIAILRGDFGGLDLEIAAALLEAGVSAMEVTLNSPNALASIGRLAGRIGIRMAVGAGTVLHPTDVQRAADAGAQFIVSPNCHLGVIAETKRRALASFPGCFSPTEIVVALDAGADAAKLFPAQCLGPGYVKALRGPFPNLPLIPTGGVTPESAREYVRAGAWAVGVGGELLGRDVRAPGGLEALRRRALGYVAAMQPGGPA